MRGLAWLAVAWLAACGGAMAKPPVIAADADLPTRQKTYDDAKLEYRANLLGKQWHRTDGTYAPGGLTDVAQPYSDVQGLLSRGQTRGIVIGSVGGLGAALVGYTLGYNLAAPSDKRMSDGAQIALYGTGAGIIVVSIIIALVWHDPLDDVAGVYNGDLRRDLALPDPPPPVAPVAPAAPPAASLGWRWRY